MTVKYTEIPTGYYTTVGQLATELRIQHRSLLNKIVVEQVPMLKVAGYFHLIRREDADKLLATRKKR